MRKKEITIPNELREITLSKYLKIREMLSKPDLDELEMSTLLVSICCEISIDEIRSLSIDDFNGIVDILNKTLNEKSNFVSPPSFKLDGIEYGFIPNLDDMSFGEYVDLDTFLRDEQDLNKVMGILYRPITDKVMGRYRIAEYTGKENFDIMYDAPMDVVNYTIVFFYHLGNALLKATKDYLEKEMKGISASKQALGPNGVGIKASMRFLGGDLTNLIPQQNYQFIKRSHSLYSKKKSKKSNKH